MKDTNEILKKVRKIEIKTRGLSRNIFAGEYHTAFKGRGMTFSEVREYQYGDDIRNIDWNVTARFNKPYIKVFEEEREMTMMLVVDVSASGEFGTVNQIKRDMLAEIAATIAFSAIQNNDKIGVILFSDRIEKFIPPQKGKKHVLYIIRELLGFEPVSKKTDIQGALQYLTNAIKKRCTAFIISDFISSDFSKSLVIANRKHDMVALQIYDKREIELPSVGLIKVKDAESDQDMWIDTSDKKIRNAYQKYWLDRQETLKQTFNQSGVDTISIATDEDYVKALMKLFRHRA
ncbi:MAG: DUF58 domain-containing protein [Paludibacteraceae bacterium]|jgi:uncharacterized protein (DUF58 family)|nr:DUF58 domain-containing protein [Paludibacteraceae bacterium]MEE3482889.1 DUF58 domain-containing protein [Bacteroidales bacterium]